MKSDVKKAFDEIAPTHLTFSKEKQRETLQKARATKKNPKRHSFRFASFITMASVAVVMLLFIINKEQINKEQSIAMASIEKIEVPFNEEEKQMTTYDDESNTLNTLATSQSGEKLIKSFSLHSKKEMDVLDVQNAKSFVRSGKTIIANKEDALLVANLKTDERMNQSDVFARYPKLIGKQYIFQSSNGTIQFMNLDGKTNKKIILEDSMKKERGEVFSDQQSTKTGGSTIENKLLSYSSQYVAVANVTKSNVKLDIYNLKNEKVGSKTIALHGEMEDMKMSDDKIYYRVTQSKKKSELMSFDLKEHRTKLVPISNVAQYDVFGDKLAVEIQRPNHVLNVQVYRENKNEYKNLHVFDEYKEGMNNPRFSQKGTLLVNSNDKDGALYLWRDL